MRGLPHRRGASAHAPAVSAECELPLEFRTLPFELESRLVELLLASYQLLHGQLLGALAGLGGSILVADILEISHETLTGRMMAPVGGAATRSFLWVTSQNVVD